MDSPGNDIETISGPADVNALMRAIESKWPDDEQNERIAAFNTLGLIKSKVVYPLRPDPGSFPTLLDGIYIRVDFRSFCYVLEEPLSSDPNSIDNDCSEPGNITRLIELTKPRSNADGFCADGRIQSRLSYQGAAYSATCPAVDPCLPPRGSYVRTGWPGFVYFPGLTCPDANITRRFESGRPFHELVDTASRDARVVAFGSDGSLMDRLGERIGDCQDGVPSGIYVKIPSRSEGSGPDGMQANKESLFIFWMKKAAGYTLFKLLLHDPAVRNS